MLILKHKVTDGIVAIFYSALVADFSAVSFHLSRDI